VLTRSVVALVFALAFAQGGLIPTAAAQSADLRAFVGDRQATLVVLDRAEGGTMYVLSTEDGTLKKLSDEVAIQSPLLSHDGTRVVYNQSGNVYMQPLDGSARELVTEGSEGHWWRDGQGEAWIYYTTNAKEVKLRWPDSKGVKTHRRRLSDGKDEWVIDWKVGGGASRDGRFVGAGYATVVLFDLQAGTEHLMYDKGQGQGCNPSMSPDDSYLLMHLDLPHATFSIRDKDDRQVWSIETPAGAHEWQHPEWSTDGDFATATVEEDNGAYSVMAVRLSTKETLKLLDASADARDWTYPHLWIQSSVADVPGAVLQGSAATGGGGGGGEGTGGQPAQSGGGGGVGAGSGGERAGVDGGGGCSVSGAGVGLSWLLLAALFSLRRKWRRGR